MGEWEGGRKGGKKVVKERGREGGSEGKREGRRDGGAYQLFDSYSKRCKDAYALEDKAAVTCTSSQELIVT